MRGRRGVGSEKAIQESRIKRDQGVGDHMSGEAWERRSCQGSDLKSSEPGRLKQDRSSEG